MGGESRQISESKVSPVYTVKLFPQKTYIHTYKQVFKKPPEGKHEDPWEKAESKVLVTGIF